MLVELSISTRRVCVGVSHGALSILKSYSHSSQFDEEESGPELGALSRTVPVVFPVLEIVPRIGEVSS